MFQSANGEGKGDERVPSFYVIHGYTASFVKSCFVDAGTALGNARLDT